MAKNQSRKPGRDVRGGGAGAAKGGAGKASAGSYRPGANKGSGSGSGGRGNKGSYQAASKASGSARGAGKAANKGSGSGKGSYQAATKGGGSPHGAGAAGRPSSSGRSDLIEGRRAVEEALACGMPLKGALVLARTGKDDPDSDLELLARRLDEAGVPVERVPRARLDALSSHGAHQGVVVRTRPFEYAELADVIAAAGQGDALVVVLDHVTDQGNLGAIVRSAEVVGAAGVVVAKARSAPVGVGAYKTSAGAVLHLPVAQVPNLARALDELKRAGFWACCASEHAEQDVWHAPMGGRLALVVGSEGEGVSRLVAQSCDFACRLPQRGRIESLNVAQATTVLCYEWLRRVELREGTGAVVSAEGGPAAEGGPTAKTGPASAAPEGPASEADPAGWLPDAEELGAAASGAPGDFVADALADLGFGGYEPDTPGDGLDG